MTREELEKQAFWDRAVCTECGGTQEAESEACEPCETCASPAVYRAQTILRIFAFVEVEGEAE